MIKRILGISKLEGFFKSLSEKMGHQWDHTKNLYELHEYNKKRIEEMEKRLIRRTSTLTTMMEEVLSKLEGAADIDIRDYVIERDEEEHVTIHIADNELTILQILYDNASFESPSAISTSDIYQNVPFTITKRGLRKKLMAMLKKGLIRSVKRRNERYWHITTGKLADVKKAIKIREEKTIKRKEAVQGEDSSEPEQ